MTSPFPFRPASEPQAPFLRPDPLHEEPGALGSLAPLLMHVAGQVQQQQNQQQEMLIKRGQLAIQQEQADAAVEQHKEQAKALKQHQDALTDAATSLTQSLQNASTPEAFMQGLKDNLGKMMIADPQQAGEIVKSISGLQQVLQSRAQDADENTRIQKIISANPNAFSDPVQGRAMLQLVAGVNPKKAEDLARILPQEKGSTVLGPGQTMVDQAGKVIATGGAARPKADQLNQAELGAAAMKQWSDIEKLRIANPQVEQDAGAILTSPIFTNAIPGMKGRGDAVQAAIKAGAKGDVLAYLRAKFGFMDNIIRTRIQGGRLSGAIFNTYASELMPGADSGNPDARSAMRENERQALLSAVGKSGYDDNPDIWNKAAKRHGVAFSVEDFMAEKYDHKLAGIQDAYPN